MTLLAREPTTATAGATAGAEKRIVLEPVSWALYRQLLRELGNHAGVRLAYDNGRLEIMSPGRLHEDVKKIAARLVEAYADATDIDIQGYGSMTMVREELLKGVEPDECYYVQSFAAMAGKRELDFAVDPPPDLAIEVNISPPDLAKPPIYAALGVPEVWQYDGQRFRVLLRTGDGQYAESAASAAFPDLPVEELNRFVRIGLESHQPAAVRALRQWLRERRPAP